MVARALDRAGVADVAPFVVGPVIDRAQLREPRHGGQLLVLPAAHRSRREQEARIPLVADQLPGVLGTRDLRDAFAIPAHRRLGAAQHAILIGDRDRIGHTCHEPGFGRQRVEGALQLAPARDLPRREHRAHVTLRDRDVAYAHRSNGRRRRRLRLRRLVLAIATARDERDHQQHSLHPRARFFIASFSRITTPLSVALPASSAANARPMSS